MKADGNTVIDGTIQAGNSQTIQAANRIEFVSVGNAGGLSVKVNGRQLPSLGASGAVVNNYVIDLETLKNLP